MLGADCASAELCIEHLAGTQVCQACVRRMDLEQGLAGPPRILEPSNTRPRDAAASSTQAPEHNIEHLAGICLCSLIAASGSADIDPLLLYRRWTRPSRAGAGVERMPK